MYGELQLSLGGADGLVAALHAHGRPFAAQEAAGRLFALRGAPPPLVRRLLHEVVRSDSRLCLVGEGDVGLAAWSPPAETLLEDARFCVVDLETTGVGRGARIVEIGAVRIERLEVVGSLERLVDPGVPLPPVITSITGIRPRDLKGAGPVGPALRELLRLAEGCVLVAHNARFDVGFLQRALGAIDGRRLELPVLDTVALARRLLAGRGLRCDLHSLADRFSLPTQPIHRALPDALATGELLVHLIGLAQERGARTVEDVLDLGSAAPRPAQTRRRHAARVPSGPGVYILRDQHGNALYVGKAGDLRARVRSYFGSRKQKPALEAALGALSRIDSVPLGSELEAALVELELIRAWRPPANSRSTRPERGRYLRLGVGDPLPTLALRDAPRSDGALYAGPLASRRTAETALEALRDSFGLRTCRPRLPTDEGTCLRGRLGRCIAPCRGADESELYAAAIGRLERYLDGRGEGGRAELRLRLAKLVAERRFEEAGRRVGDLAALDRVDAALASLRRSRSRSGLLLASDMDPAFVRCLVVRDGRALGWRSLPRRGDPSAVVGSALHELGRTLPVPDGAPRGPWLPADEAEAAVLIAGAFAGRAAGVVPVATPPQIDLRLVLARVAQARSLVPERPPVPRAERRDWRALHQVEPATGMLGVA
ncbi:MAG: exonuclease domain-containing protein [Gaiellales bacterium]